MRTGAGHQRSTVRRGVPCAAARAHSLRHCYLDQASGTTGHDLLVNFDRTIAILPSEKLQQAGESSHNEEPKRHATS